MQGTSFALATGEDVWLLGETYTIADEAENKELHEQVMMSPSWNMLPKANRNYEWLSIREYSGHKEQCLIGCHRL